MRNPTTKLLLAALAALALASCGVEDRAGDGDGDGDDDGGADGDSDSDSDSDTDADSGPGGDTTLQGKVYAPSGAFPISGALVYVTTGDAEVIPDHAYCYACDDMTGLNWTLSGPDGSWTLENVPAGTRNLVTRKGFFRRQRQIEVSGDPSQDVPAEITTLPSAPSADGLDVIPSYAVLLNNYDLAEDMLAKMGLGDLDGSGHLVQGTEEFDLYNDANSSSSAVGSAAALFASQETIDGYHMIFFPCICSGQYASAHLDMLRAYISGGGKVYGSCWASQWAEQPYPEVIEFNGDDTVYNAGNIGYWDSFGTINDVAMRDWLAVVSAGTDPDSFPFYGGYILIDSLSSTAYDGHGSDTDGDGVFTGPVIPTAWVTDVSAHAGAPLTVTYPYDCGKVFYSTYQVVESSPSPAIRPQEWVLIYLFFEVGVCEGSYIPPE